MTSQQVVQRNRDARARAESIIAKIDTDMSFERLSATSKHFIKSGCALYRPGEFGRDFYILELLSNQVMYTPFLSATQLRHMLREERILSQKVISGIIEHWQSYLRFTTLHQIFMHLTKQTSLEQAEIIIQQVYQSLKQVQQRNDFPS